MKPSSETLESLTVKSMSLAIVCLLLMESLIAGTFEN